MPLLLNRIALVLSAIGIFVAGVLSYSHLALKSVGCGETGGCDWLVGRPESKVGNVPIAVIGFGAYLVFFGISALRASNWEKFAPKLNKISLGLATFGFLASMTLVFMLTVVWHQQCKWCFGSAATMTCLFIVHVLMQKWTNAEGKNENLDSILVPFFLVGALGASAAVSTYGGTEKMIRAGSGLSLAKMLPDQRYFRGNPDARVTVVEVADFYCPSCRNFSYIFKNIENNYKDNVRMGYRTFPLYKLPGHEMSLQAAMAAEYALENDRYWQFYEAMYSDAGGRAASEEDLSKIVDSAGLDGKKWLQTFQDDQKKFDSILDFTVQLRESGIFGTPTYVVFVDGKDPVFMPANEIEEFLKRPKYAEILTSSPAPAPQTTP